MYHSGMEKSGIQVQNRKIRPRQSCPCNCIEVKQVIFKQYKDFFEFYVFYATHQYKATKIGNFEVWRLIVENPKFWTKRGF